MEQLYALLIFYSIVAIAVWVIIETNEKYGWNKILNGCLVDCVGCGELFGKRGSDYDFGTLQYESDKVPYENCFTTFWNFSHFLTHLIGGYLAPDYFLLDFLLGVGFEAYESQYACQDPNDIIANTLGFVTGRYLATGKV